MEEDKKLSQSLTKKEIKQILGLSDENFDFYVSSNMILKSVKGKYKYKLKMHDMVLERGTVFKYCFEDGFQEEMREFLEVVKHNGKVKIFTKEEIEEYQKSLDNNKK